MILDLVKHKFVEKQLLSVTEDVEEKLGSSTSTRNF